MSKRDRFKQTNLAPLISSNKQENLTDDIVTSLENKMDSNEIKPEVKNILVPPEELKKEVKNKRRKFADDAVTKFLNVQLLESEIKFLEKYGGEFGGKTGYVRKLVQEEMKRVNKQ